MKIRKIITILITLLTIISMFSNTAASAVEKISDEQADAIFDDWFNNYSMKTFISGDWVYAANIHDTWTSGDDESSHLIDREMVYEISEYRNKNATSVVVPSSLDGKKIYSVTRPTFMETPNLKKVTFSNGIRTVGGETFENHKKLKEIILPTSIIYINVEAFHNCKNLKKVTLPKNIFIEQGAFKNCKNLKKLNYKGTAEREHADILSDSSYISKEAFANCVKLEKINLGKAYLIGSKVFYNCKNLSKAILGDENNSPEIGKNAFKNTKQGIKFVVKNKKVAKSLKKQLKGSGVKKAKILVGKKVVYTSING